MESRDASKLIDVVKDLRRSVDGLTKVVRDGQPRPTAARPTPARPMPLFATDIPVVIENEEMVVGKALCHKDSTTGLITLEIEFSEKESQNLEHLMSTISTKFLCFGGVEKGAN